MVRREILLRCNGLLVQTKFFHHLIKRRIFPVVAGLVSQRSGPDVASRKETEKKHSLACHHLQVDHADALDIGLGIQLR